MAKDWLTTLEKGARKQQGSNPDLYEKNRHYKDNASLGMDDVDIEEEWSFEKEVYGRDPYAVTRLHTVHPEGIEQALQAGVDLDTCYVCEVGVTRPKFQPDNVDLFLDKYPAVHSLHKNDFYVLGFGSYKKSYDRGCIDLSVYLVDTHLTSTTYSHTGLVRPPIIFKKMSYLLDTTSTPDWIKNHGRTIRAD